MQAIVVGGNISSGKTTVAPRIAEALGACFSPEPVALWRKAGKLDAFYKGEISAFEFQKYVLETRSAALQPRLAEWKRRHGGGLPRLIVFDRWLDDDRMFAAVNRQRGSITAEEMAEYEALHAAVKRSFDGQFSAIRTVWLDTPPEVCARRILERARPEEAGITLDYLRALDAARPASIDFRVDYREGEPPEAIVRRVVEHVDVHWRPSAIVATAADNTSIGKDGKLPWRAPDDLAFFKGFTAGRTVIVGKRTYQGIPGGLPGRDVRVLTRNPVAANELTWDQLEERVPLDGTCVFAGGAEVYREAFRRNLVGRVVHTTLHHVTEIQGGPADAHIAIPAAFQTHTQQTIAYRLHHQ